MYPPTRQQLENRKKDGPYLVLGGLALIVAVMTLGGLLNIIFSIT